MVTHLDLDLTYWQTAWQADLAWRQHAPDTAQRFAAALGHFFDYLRDRGVGTLDTIPPGLLRAYGTRVRTDIPDRAGMTQQLLAVKTFLRFLAQAGHLREDAGVVAMWFPVSDAWCGERLTPVEVEAMLLMPNVRTPLGLRDRAVLDVLYSTGLRAVEVRRLDLAAVHLAEGQLLLRGKNGALRALPLGPSEPWLRAYLERGRPALVQSPEETAVFLTGQGRPLDVASLQAMVRQTVQATGIEKPVTPRAWREAALAHRLPTTDRRRN